LIDLEAQILVTLGFDFNFPGPIQPLERYLRILNYDLNEIIFDMSYQICKFQLNDAQFLTYRPSQIAASALLLAINIYEKDIKKPSNNDFFKNSRKVGSQIEFNTEIWNNEFVHKLTFHSMEDIKQCLYDLSMFICNNLQPNRLEGFYIEGILATRNYNAIPSPRKENK